MKHLTTTPLILLAISAILPADEVSTIKAYVDTGICAHLLLGPISTERTDCTKKSFKDGAQPFLVDLATNRVLEVNKPKMVKELVGQFAEATGEVKVKDAKIKLQSVKPLDTATIPQGDPARKLLDVRTFKTASGPAVFEKVRHELAMMPYITEFDFISFTMNGGDVILTGYTVRITNRGEAENRVKTVEGVTSVTNNIEVLPMGQFDMSIRAGARAALQRTLSRYFWGSGSDIKIIVKNGVIVLLGSVASKADSDLAYIQCNGVPSAFKVVNLLRINAPAKKG